MWIKIVDNYNGFVKYYTIKGNSKYLTKCFCLYSDGYYVSIQNFIRPVQPDWMIIVLFWAF